MEIVVEIAVEIAVKKEFFSIFYFLKNYTMPFCPPKGHQNSYQIKYIYNKTPS